MLLPLAGGVLADGLLGKQSAATLRRVMAPKASGIANLSTRMAALPVGALVAFSSIASLLGNAGQANCAAANGALDAWAQHSSQKVSQALPPVPQPDSYKCQSVSAAAPVPLTAWWQDWVLNSWSRATACSHAQKPTCRAGRVYALQHIACKCTRICTACKCTVIHTDNAIWICGCIFAGAAGKQRAVGPLEGGWDGCRRCQPCSTPAACRLAADTPAAGPGCSRYAVSACPIPMPRHPV